VDPPAVAPPATALGEPVELTIPALDVTAPVDGILTSAGVLHPPDDPSRVGWWVASSLPGAPTGPTVLVGHVDSAGYGPGALYRLTEMGLGSTVTIATSDHQAVNFQVTGRSVHSKFSGLPADLFDLEGPARLLLITCGGNFDETTGSYEDNVVLSAIPSRE